MNSDINKDFNKAIFFNINTCHFGPLFVFILSNMLKKIICKTRFNETTFQTDVFAVVERRFVLTTL